ncbi:membrane-bound lytic murein transglycosylase MltF [Reinekea marinisedimentorum]|uniref:Membrane-bound lytic murein transglycosylase F n=1 Tax=Reinekea marinisedimentorum TaxID=230495 RepID=A0A4R3I6E8_9GAMM|nr:membrane-bound lytic murein transglycosylase MltF [Reinekea marinisedimentorum]TCS41664.1 membrane-bound lytic murein transglycosylase F [Reinekea marinisedimentorum]
MRLIWLNPKKTLLKIFLLLLIVAGLGYFVAKGFKWHSHWAQIERRGSLVVAVRESEGVYWPSGQNFIGLEHDLIEEIERHLEIPVQVFAVRDLDDLYRSLEVGAVDMALPGTSIRNVSWPVSKPYGTTVIGLATTGKDLTGSDNIRTGILDTVAHQDAINVILKKTPYSSAIYEHGRFSAELFTLLEMGDLEQVLIDRRDFTLQQSIFPKLEFTSLNLPGRTFNIQFSPNEDGTLKERVDEVLDLFDQSGLLVQIKDRYLGSALEFDYVDNLTFEKHMASRLPKYIDLFKTHAALNDMDWRLLAAIAYQESHWRPNARSPTGVRGMMMVTQATAKEMGISNRLDPEQSILAGARYFASLKTRVVDRITDPDRTWFALAAYNVGAGHLEDARKITDLLEDDPDRWIDVRKHLPKLALKDYYPWTRYGYARGAEPVVYVANIRRFYEKLKKEYPELDEAVQPERLDQLPDAIIPVFPGS